MPIAINPEHQALADSVRSLVARVAPSEVLHEAMETPVQNPPPYWQAAAAGTARRAPSRIGWRPGLRHLGAGHRAGRIRLRRGARAVRAVGDRQRIDRRTRPQGRGTRRTGLGGGHRRLRAGFDHDRHPPGAGRQPGSGDPRRSPGGARRGTGVDPGAAGGHRQWRGVGGAARRPTRDRAGAKCRPAASGGARARQRRRGRRRHGAGQPEHDGRAR